MTCRAYMYVRKDCKVVSLPGTHALILFGILLTAMPTISGVSEMDYPLQGPGLLSAPNLPELSAVRRIPLPPELVEQFSRILYSYFLFLFVHILQEGL